MYLVFALLLDDGDVEVPSLLKKGRSTGVRVVMFMDSTLVRFPIRSCYALKPPRLRCAYLTRCILSKRVYSYSRLLIRVPRTAIIIKSKPGLIDGSFLKESQAVMWIHY